MSRLSFPYALAVAVLLGFHVATSSSAAQKPDVATARHVLTLPTQLCHNLLDQAAAAIAGAPGPMVYAPELSLVANLYRFVENRLLNFQKYAHLARWSPEHISEGLDIVRRKRPRMTTLQAMTFYGILDRYLKAQSSNPLLTGLLSPRFFGKDPSSWIWKKRGIEFRWRLVKEIQLFLLDAHREVGVAERAPSYYDNDVIVSLMKLKEIKAVAEGINAESLEANSAARRLAELFSFIQRTDAHYFIGSWAWQTRQEAMRVDGREQTFRRTLAARGHNLAEFHVLTLEEARTRLWGYIVEKDLEHVVALLDAQKEKLGGHFNIALFASDSVSVLEIANQVDSGAVANYLLEEYPELRGIPKI